MANHLFCHESRSERAPCMLVCECILQVVVPVHVEVISLTDTVNLSPVKYHWNIVVVTLILGLFWPLVLSVSWLPE